MSAAHASFPVSSAAPAPAASGGGLILGLGTDCSSAVKRSRALRAKQRREQTTRRGRAHLRSDSQERGHRDPVRFTRRPETTPLRAGGARCVAARGGQDVRYRLRVLESQSRRARRDMPLPRPSRGTSRHRITLSGARRAAGGFAGASRTKPATARCCEKRRTLVVGETLSKAKTTPAAFTSSACCSAGSAAPVSRAESRS